MGIEVEDDVAGFLGVHINWKDDSKILMTQMGMADWIVKTPLNIGDKPCKKSPAIYGCFGQTWM
jgi:hypothetical protein